MESQRVPAMRPEPSDPSVPSSLPLAGDRGTLPDDRLLYLAAILRGTPVPAPALSPEAWQGFLDVLKPHGVHPLMAYRLRAECRPPAEVMGHLNRIFLNVAARSMKAGRTCQQHSTSEGRLFIEPRDRGRRIGPARCSGVSRGVLPPG